MCELAHAAALLTQLRVLDLSHNAVDDTAAAALAPWVARQPALERLDLENTPLKSAGVQAILRALRNARHLTHLDLSTCEACPSKMLRLVSELAACHRLLHFGFPEQQCLGGEAGSEQDIQQALADVRPQTLAGLSALTHFAPPESLVEAVQSAGAVATGLPHLQSLQKLKLLGWNAGSEGDDFSSATAQVQHPFGVPDDSKEARMLAAAMLSLTQLTLLSAHGYADGSGRTAVPMCVLSSLHKLQELDVSCQVGQWKELGQQLRALTALTCLCVDKIDDHVATLAPHLPAASRLRKLSVSGSNLFDRAGSCQRLCDALSSMLSLHVFALKLWGWDVQVEAYEREELWSALADLPFIRKCACSIEERNYDDDY
jgi:Leucine Rich repeat